MIRTLARVLYAGTTSWVLLSVLLLTGCAQNKPVASSKPRAFWPPYPNEPRLQFLVSYQKSTDVQPSKNSLDKLIYGKEPEQVLPLTKPYGVRMWKGRIYICDLRNRSITILDLRRQQTLVMGKTGAEPLVTPSDIAIAPDGIKYVADSGRGMLMVFDEQDRYVRALGHEGLKPVGVAVYQNELYVSNFAGQRVEVLDRFSGERLRTIGGPGLEPGKFIRPLGIAVDAQGDLYVSDVMKCQIQKFDRQGKYLAQFSGVSNNAGGLVRPKHIATDNEGVLYVVDAAFQNVQLFDSMGRVLTFFGSPGAHPGAMYMPAGICVHDGDMDLFKDYIDPAFEPKRLVIVTNQFGDNKVSIYAMGHLRPGKTVHDIANSQGLVPAGTSDKPSIFSATQPTTQPSAEPAETAAR